MLINNAWFVDFNFLLRFQVKEAAIEKCTIKLKGLNETNARRKERVRHCHMNKTRCLD